MKKILSLGLSLLMASGLATASTPSSALSPSIPVSGLRNLQSSTGVQSIPASDTSETARVMAERHPRGLKSDGISQHPAKIGRRQNAIARKSLSGAKFYTWLGNSEDDPSGWYSFDTDGSYSLLWTCDAFSQFNVNITNGWMRDGKLCGFAVMNAGGMVFYLNYVEFDPKTGRFLKEEGLSPDGLIDMGRYYISCAYVPEEDRIYGYTQTTEQDGFRFCSSPGSDPGNVTVIKQLTDYTERTNALCYNPEQGKLVGVNFNNEVVSVDFNGNQTKLYTLPLDNVKNDKAAFAYSPYDGCYIYTPTYYSYASQLYYVYPEDQQIRFVRNFPGTEQFFFFLSEGYEYDAEAPGRPVFVSEDMVPGSLSGSWTLRMPEKTAGGEALTGDMTWTLYIDNVKSESGSAAPGGEVTVSVGPMEQGEHVIRVSCTDAAGKEGLPYVVDRWFGNGIPMQPEDVEITRTSVSWAPVTEAVLDGYLEPGKMRYEVYVNDKFVGSTSDTSMPIELDPEVPVTAYYAYVAASCNGQMSERTKSSGKVIFGAPLPLPYTVVPTAAQAELCEVFNLDGSPSYGTWEFYETRWHEPVFASGWSREPADDWLVLPPVDCSDLSHAYRLTIDAICGGLTGKDERFEVWCGNEPDPKAMDTLIIPETQVTEFITEGWETFSNLFVPKKAGATYVAVRAVSPADQHSLIVRHIVIEPTDELADVPEAPADFTVTSKNDAELTATVSLTAPVKTIAGRDITSADALKLHVGVGDKWDERDAAPGEKLTLTLDTYQGDNRLIAYCSINGQNGQEATANIFTGTIPPNFIQNFASEVSRDNMTVHMSWTPPIEGQENLEGYYSPEGMHYWLCELVRDPVYGDSEWKPVKNIGNVLEYDYTISEGSPLQIKYVGIAAANNGGVSDAIWYTYRQIGTPYKPEIKEDFIVGDDMGVNYTPLIVGQLDDSSATWTPIMPEELGSDLWNPDIPYAIAAWVQQNEPGATRLQLPKFSTVGVKDPGLTMTLYTSDPCTAPVSVYAMTYGIPMTKIYDVPFLDKGWQDVVVPLPKEFREMPWIQLGIDAYLPDYYSFAVLGGYSFGTVDLSGVKEVGASNVAVLGGKGEIVLKGIERKQVSVFALDGRMIGHYPNARNEGSIRVHAGVYFVMIGDDVHKVIVR